MKPYQRPQRNPRVGALMWNLRIDAAAAELVRALSERGIDSMILKGASFNDWYPDDAARTYVDADLWVAPQHVSRTEATLSELGFVPTSDERSMPEWWLEHGSSWIRPSDAGKIDLHRRLQGVELEPSRVWELLWSQREQFTLAGSVAYRLPEGARVLYATLHATHHGTADARGLPHLHAALAAVDEPTWRAALELAVELDALESFATGVRLVPEGAELAERLQIPDVRSVKTALLASTPPPVALGFDQLAAAGPRRRLRILRRKFFPPAGFIRHWWPPAARSRLMLAVGYVYRPVWLLKNAPEGYRAWRVARRAVKSSS